MQETLPNKMCEHSQMRMEQYESNRRCRRKLRNPCICQLTVLLLVDARRPPCSGVGRPVCTGPAKVLAPHDGVDALPAPSLEMEIRFEDGRLPGGTALRPRAPDISAREVAELVQIRCGQ